MSTTTPPCSEHPNYLDALTEADAQQRSLPVPAAGCSICANAHTLFIETSEVLRWREHEEPALLSENWQLGVWLKLSEQHAQPDHATVTSPEPVATVVPLASHTKRQAGKRSMYAPLIAAAALLAIVSGVALWQMMDTPPPAKKQPKVAKQQKSLPRGVDVELMAYSLKGDRVNTLKPGARISSGDQLSFDYLNVPERHQDEMRYLTVVALVRSQEAQGKAAAPNKRDLRWIAQSEPIEATNGKQPRVLGSEDTTVDAPPGKMTIYGLFSRQPLSADEVEQVLLARRSSKPRLSGIDVARLDLRVD